MLKAVIRAPRSILRAIGQCFLIGALASSLSPAVAAASSVESAASHAYRLPSDRSKSGLSRIGGLDAGYAGQLHVSLTKSGACADIGSLSVVWPAGYRVRFHPTQLIDSAGNVVASDGQTVSAAGVIVGNASWPSASRCYGGGTLVAVHTPIEVSKRGLPFS